MIKCISLESAKETVSGAWGKSGVLFLVWNGSNYEFTTFATIADHCIAAFCRQDDNVVAVRMHNSISFGNGSEHSKHLSLNDNVHIGLTAFKVAFNKKTSGEDTLIEKKRRRFSRLVLVGLIAALAGLMGFLFLRTTETKPSKAVSVTAPVETTQQNLQMAWQIQRLISDAKKFSSAFDPLQAQMSLEQVLAISPENTEARQLLDNLKNNQSAVNKHEEISSELIERGEMLIKQAEEAMANANYKLARENYIKAAGLFSDMTTKPAYYAKIEEGIKSSESKLDESLSPKLRQISELIAANSDPKLKEAVLLAKNVLSNWPEHSKAVAELKRAYEGLDKLALPFVMKADTLRQLSGCKNAVPQYKIAMETAAYPEVPAYQKAEVGIGQCN